MDGQDPNANDLIYLVSYYFEPITNATYLYNTSIEAEKNSESAAEAAEAAKDIVTRAEATGNTLKNLLEAYGE
jgi:hypothetical protein